MINTPHWPWLTVFLALLILGDVALSIRPPEFIRQCLHGVRLPEDWWWTLIVIKLSAVAGLVAGLRLQGVGLAANVGVCIYFSCAAYAHYRARFLRREFWFNCLGMLLLCLGVLIVSYAIR